MENGIYWNAVRTRPQAAKKICRTLEKKSIRYYYPAGQQCKTGNAGFLQGIVFVAVSGTDQLQALKNISDALSILYWQKQPAFFTHREISLLRFFLESHAAFEVNNIGVCAAETVQEFAVTTHAGQYVHNLVLPSLGYRLCASVKTATNIRILKRTSPNQNASNGLKVIPGFQKTWNE